ncbi:Y3295-like protein [Mya arenaria]|uniref:Y3295-like protein n=1 Tax=Mya arenaria TaxID=6604 RepID=A0ABY7DY46_MYAAR|nr:Y3295-like protein [Mya arenaria]
MRSAKMEGYTNEDENFTRLLLLLMKCGTPVAVELLIDRKNALSPSTYKPDPWTLHEFLKDKEDSITKRIKTQHIMKQKSILEKLFPKDQNDLNPNEWDLPLLIFVITTCCQMSSGDFIVQHLYKMKEVRNTLCHTNRPSISTAKYETMRDRVHGAIKEILNYIDNSSLRERIKEEMRKYKKDAIGSLTAFKTSLDEWFNHERQQTDILLELKEDVAKVGEKVTQVDEKVTQVDEKVTQVDVKVAEVLKLGEALQTMLNVVRIGICQSDLGNKIPVPVTSAPMITISRTEEVKEAALLFISAWSDHSSKEGIQQAIHEAMTRIWGTNECVDVKLACVLFEIKCPSLEALVSLLEDCASGKLTTFVKPVETEMRKEDRWKNIELDVTLNETELKKTIDDIISEAELIRLDENAQLDEPMNETTDSATGCFENTDEAMAILQKRPVLIDNGQVQVEMFVPEPMHTVMVEFGTQDRDDPETTLNDLVVYLDGKTNCYVSEETSWYDPGLDKFFVTLDDPDVVGVKSAESRDIIMLYFEDKDQSGGGDVHDVESDSENEDVIYIRFKRVDGVEIVLKKGLTLGKQQLRVTRYFECIGKGEDGTVLPKQTPPAKEKSLFLPSTSTVPPFGLPLYCHTTFNSTRIYAYHGDITTLSVDVIVNPSDSRLTMLGLLGKEIENRGGRDVVEECKIRVLEGPMASTDVFVSNGGKLKAAKIAHIVTPQWEGLPEDERSILSEIVTNVLITASKTFKKIAFPAVGCGVGKFPKKIATQEIVSAAKKYLQENKETPLTDLYFCDTNQETVGYFTNAMQKEFSEGIVETAATGQQRFQHSFPEMTHGDILEPTRHTHPSREKRTTMIDSPTRIERPADMLQ